MKVFKVLDREIKRHESNKQRGTQSERIEASRQHSLMTKIKKEITEDTTMNVLMGVYNYIEDLENKLKEANEIIEDLKRENNFQFKELLEYKSEFGISTAQKNRNKENEKLASEDASFAMQELYELGCFDDE